MKRLSLSRIALKRAFSSQRGTTLLEMLVAVALFAIVSGVAFTLFSQQQSAAQTMNGQIGLNMALRSTVSLLEMDLVNAGSGYYQNANMSNGVLGVTILNNVVASNSSCYTSSTNTYGPSCYDQLNILQVDPSSPVINVTDSNGGFTTSDISNTNTGTAYGSLSGMTNAQATTQAATYHVGDRLLFVANDGSKYTVVTLTAVPTTSNNIIAFTFTPTAVGGSNTFANDPLSISSCSGASPCPPTSVTNVNPSYLGSQFDGNDYIMKLSWVSYQVCSGPGSPTTLNTGTYGCANNPTADSTNPRLIRSTVVNGTAVTSTVMEQVIGFKVGGSVWNDPDSVDFEAPYYNYDSSTYSTVSAGGKDEAYNFTLLKSVRISLIGRTVPATTKTVTGPNGGSYAYTNAFDGGPYQVQGTAMVVNPRNMNGQND